MVVPPACKRILAISMCAPDVQMYTLLLELGVLFLVCAKHHPLLLLLCVVAVGSGQLFCCWQRPAVLLLAAANRCAVGSSQLLCCWQQPAVVNVWNLVLMFFYWCVPGITHHWHCCAAAAASCRQHSSPTLSGPMRSCRSFWDVFYSNYCFGKMVEQLSSARHLPLTPCVTCQ